MSKFIFLGQTIYNQNLISSVGVHVENALSGEDKKYCIKVKIEGQLLTIFESSDIDKIGEEQGRIFDLLNN